MLNSRVNFSALISRSSAGCSSGMNGPQSNLQGPGSILKEVIQVQLDFDFKIEMDLDLASVAFPAAQSVVVSSLTE